MIEVVIKKNDLGLFQADAVLTLPPLCKVTRQPQQKLTVMTSNMNYAVPSANSLKRLSANK